MLKFVSKVGSLAALLVAVLSACTGVNRLRNRRLHLT